MARMSIDDKFLRDPRITQLSLDLGVSRWDAMGRLLAVFAVCYDLERDTIGAALIDHAADRQGFADAMFAVDLAVNTRRGMRIRGAGKRIEYLAPKREAGRQGGIKSGESRRNSTKQKRQRPSEASEAFLNPPDPVPDLVPDPVPEDQSSPPARAIAPTAVPSGVPTTPVAATPVAPPVPLPAPEREDIARTIQPPKPAISSPPALDLADPRSIGILAEVIYRRVSDARIAVAAELKLPPPIAFPEPGPSRQTRGFVELRARIREEGAPAESVCVRVVANLIAQAREDRSIEWLAEKAFGDKAWDTAKNWIPRAQRAKSIAPSRHGKPEVALMPTPPRFAPVEPIADPVLDAAPFQELLAKLTTDGARAPPASATVITDEQQPNREGNTQ